VSCCFSLSLSLSLYVCLSKNTDIAYLLTNARHSFVDFVCLLCVCCVFGLDVCHFKLTPNSMNPKHETTVCWDYVMCACLCSIALIQLIVSFLQSCLLSVNVLYKFRWSQCLLTTCICICIVCLLFLYEDYLLCFCYGLMLKSLRKRSSSSLICFHTCEQVSC
jgi:hypothetical protein